jgi:ABC-2 type transport system permease protein
MLAVLAIARKDIRQRLRDRSALIVGVVAPVAVAAVMAFAFRGVENFTFSLGVVNLDHGPVAAGILKAFSTPQLRQIITVKSISTKARASDEVAHGKLGAGLVIPSGFSSSVESTKPETLVTLASDQNPIAGSVAASVVSSFAAQLNADRLSVLTALEAGSHASIPQLATVAATLHIPIETLQQPIGAHQLKIISYYSPGMAIFFLLFTISYTSRSFFVDRDEKMIERMRAAPIRPVEILLGKALSVLVYGAVSLATIGIVTTAAFGANWGAPGPAIVVGLALIVSVVFMTALVIGLSRTQRQAEGIASVLVFGLALLGGNFFFISSAPSLMKRLALLTPNGWTLRAFTDLATVGGGFGTIVEPLIGIAVFTAIVGVAAVALAPRAVQS